MSKDNSHRIILIGVVLVVLLTGLVCWFTGVFSSANDEEMIRELALESIEMFNDDDWEGLAELTWPESNRESLLDEINAFQMIGSINIKEPYEILNIEVVGETATCEMQLKGTYLLNTKWSRKVKAVLVKHEGKWYVDSEATRDAINGSR